MITKEVRLWLDKVKRNEYSYHNAITEFALFSRYLTKEEIELLKSKIEESYNK